MRATLPQDIAARNQRSTIRCSCSESINEVIHALAIALLLVLIVIYAVPRHRARDADSGGHDSGVDHRGRIVMVIAGFSINVLTLLGAVLAIGLVVDDAIVVLENIVRRIELGEPPLLAAVDGSREIGFAVIATTLVLIAVFLPISFIPGNLGRLFGEFGITIAAAIAFSALISLTLVPMMTPRFFAKGIVRGRVAHAVDRFFHWLSRALRAVTARGAAGAGAGRGRGRAAVVARGGRALHAAAARVRADRGSRSACRSSLTAPEGASLQYLDRYLRQVEAGRRGRGRSAATRAAC